MLTLSIAPHGATAQAKKRIGVSFYSQTIPLYVEMRKGMEAEALKRGVDLEFQYSGNDALQQSNQIANFVTTKVDLILCSPFNKDALLNAYKAARAAGVRVISVANSLASSAMKTPTSARTGRSSALRKWRSPPRRSGKKARSVSSKDRRRSRSSTVGIRACRACSPNPNITVAAKINGPLTIDAGLTAATNILTAHPDVKAIVAVSDELAQGAAQALK